MCVCVCIRTALEYCTVSVCMWVGVGVEGEWEFGGKRRSKEDPLSTHTIHSVMMHLGSGLKIFSCRQAFRTLLPSFPNARIAVGFREGRPAREEREEKLKGKNKKHKRVSRCKRPAYASNLCRTLQHGVVGRQTWLASPAACSGLQLAKQLATFVECRAASARYRSVAMS